MSDMLQLVACRNVPLGINPGYWIDETRDKLKLIGHFRDKLKRPLQKAELKGSISWQGQAAPLGWDSWEGGKADRS